MEENKFIESLKDMCESKTNTNDSNNNISKEKLDIIIDAVVRNSKNALDYIPVEIKKQKSKESGIELE